MSANDCAPAFCVYPTDKVDTANAKLKVIKPSFLILILHIIITYMLVKIQIKLF